VVTRGKLNKKDIFAVLSVKDTSDVIKNEEIIYIFIVRIIYD